MVSVPDDVIAAARIDGASEWRTYRFIILPLARPVLATLAIFTFMSA
jgi:ABC-type glycerol-3-phosphate transport system permease component